ncbi:glycosyltransferase family 4 protein [Microlunatus elymi]|uniref:Glycosyltransferase family 4 protein n=1 Tax=Microlunatus elymi TaxID=2596828 RepID=A0A516Q1L4_9ACTN|nr:glycosyltransferase family 4 protein [Microlunatus elymi]QDP97298.1 glycosyltransferase family 4 protein [Microlunatus elymi]
MSRTDRGPFRVAMVLTGTAGGIGGHVAAVVPRLAELGLTIRIWCPADVATGPLAAVGVPVAPLSRLSGIRSADIVHSHGYKASALSAPIVRSSRVPMVTTWHNDIAAAGAARLVGATLRLISAAGSTLVLGVSPDLVQAARRLGASAELLPVPAAQLAAATQDRDPVRDRLGVAGSDVLVITVARLAPQKNLGLLLDIASRTGTGPGSPRYLIVGDGPERPMLQQRINAEQLPVRLLGHRDDIPDLLGAADLALNTSTWEGSSLAVQETLQAGVGLVITDVGGNRALLGDAVAWIRPDDPAGAAEKIRRLAADPVARAGLAAAGLRRAAGWPGQQEIAVELADRYRQVRDRERSVRTGQCGRPPRFPGSASRGPDS